MTSRRPAAPGAEDRKAPKAMLLGGAAREPAAVDWHRWGFVTPAKNQGSVSGAAAHLHASAADFWPAH